VSRILSFPSQELAVMLPQRPPTPTTAPAPGRKSGLTVFPQVSVELVKRRVLVKLEERLDMSSSKRMPQSLLRQSLRQHAEQVTEAEARSLSKADRDKIVDDVLAELLGYGPLEELFADAAVREVMVVNPSAVVARRDQGPWLPTSVKFRDEAHVRSVFERIATHADPIGPVLASMSVFDVKLPNGFRAVAVLPPDGLDHPATAVFLRERSIPGSTPSSAGMPGLPAAGPVTGSASAGAGPLKATSPTGSASAGTQKVVPGSALASPRSPGSGLLTTPPPRTGSAEPPSAPTAADPLTRHRNRIIERLLAKFANLGLFDVSRLDVNELRKVISAYVSEYADIEKIYLSDTDQGKLTLEILTSLRR
jgi:hypothetical protein